jgi:hypothetical protein
MKEENRLIEPAKVDANDATSAVDILTRLSEEMLKVMFRGM